MLFPDHVKWPCMAPPSYWEYESYTTEMAFDGAWTHEGLLDCLPMKFLFSMEQHPLDGSPPRDADATLPIRQLLVGLLNRDAVTCPRFATSEYIFGAAGRMVVMRVAPLSAPYCEVGTPDVVYSVAVLRPPGMPPLTAFQVSFYRYCIEPDQVKKIVGFPWVPDEAFEVLSHSFLDANLLSLAEIERLYNLTQLPVFFIVAWFEYYYSECYPTSNPAL